MIFDEENNRMVTADEYYNSILNPKQRYYKCSNIETVGGRVYNCCVVAVPEVQPSGNASLDRQTLRDSVMVALEDTLDVEVDSYSSMEELSWE